VGLVDKKLKAGGDYNFFHLQYDNQCGYVTNISDPDSFFLCDKICVFRLLIFKINNRTLSTISAIL
jgi:hypothetical protein